MHDNIYTYDDPDARPYSRHDIIPQNWIFSKVGWSVSAVTNEMAFSANLSPAR